MKTNLISNVVLSLSVFLVGSLATAANLSGTYEVQSNACNPQLVIGEELSIQASANSFAYGIGDPRTGVQTEFEVRIGNFVGSGEGQQVREIANYSAGGNNFNYTQTFLKGPEQPFDEITRQVKVVKNGNTVSLQDNESSSLGAACILRAL